MPADLDLEGLRSRLEPGIWPLPQRQMDLLLSADGVRSTRNNRTVMGMSIGSSLALPFECRAEFFKSLYRDPLGVD